jgi:nucleoside-diphosphate kinase
LTGASGRPHNRTHLQETTVERTLIILKPDAVQRALCGELIARFERRGLKIAGMKLLQVPYELARRHYAEHEGKPFYDGLIAYITSSPVVVIAAEGPDAIAIVRTTVGVTKPAEATPGSIRADFGLQVGRNLIHASDGPESAERELGLWFSPADLLSYERAIDQWVLE